MYFLAIDGGGSKTEFLLENEDGTALFHLISGGCNPNDGREQAEKILKDGIKQALKDRNPSETVCYAGISGCAGGENRAWLENLLSAFPFRKEKGFGDTEALFYTEKEPQTGIYAILGTGSVYFSQITDKNGRTERRRIGGWGHLFDEGGDGYALGRAALLVSLHSEEKEEEILPLLRKKCEGKLGMAVSNALSDLYRGGKSAIASFAPLVFEAANEGDKEAKRILGENIETVARNIEVCAETIRQKTKDEKIPVFLFGGLTKAGEALSLPLSERLGEEFNIRLISVPPVRGVMNYMRKDHTDNA